MPLSNPQKIKLLKLYELLKAYSDEEKPLSTNQLCAMLKAEGITCDRRTLSVDIDVLNANGFEVMRRRTRYANLFYVADRQFDLAEVKILIDAIQAASFITPAKTIALINKVSNLAGSHKATVLKENLVTFNTRKHTNEAIYYTVDTLERALQKKQKASFQYFDLDEYGSRVLRKNSERYIVNPVGLVYHEDNYYLVTYHEIHEATVNYRVDRMADVRIEDEQVAERAIALSGELGTYTERVFKMFNGPQAMVELQFDRKLIDAVHDKFGEGIEIIACKRNLCRVSVNVLVSPVFFGWCFQFGKSMKILSPESVALEIKSTQDRLRKCIENNIFKCALEAVVMWDLFDFNSDGKTSLFEKVVGIELLESIIHDKDATIDGSESDYDELDEDDFDEIDDDDDDFEDEDEF